MAIGMTYEQYWEGSPYMIKAFEKAHDLRNQIKNQEMYIMGHYVFDALTVAFSNFHLDGKKHNFNKYLKQPYDLEKQMVTEEEKNDIVAKARQKIIDSLNQWKKSWDSQHKKE